MRVGHYETEPRLAAGISVGRGKGFFRSTLPHSARVWFNRCSADFPTTLAFRTLSENTPMHARAFLVAFAIFLCAGIAAGEDWPGWRGPRSDGTVTDTGFPLTWSATDNVKWKTELPGTGHSSPLVSRGKVFVAGCVEAEKKRVLYCVDRATGKI